MKARLPHDFIIKLKQYDLINVLFHISIYSSKLFHNSDDDLTAARRETLRLGSSVGQILIPGWFLVDMAYMAIKHCNGNKTIQNENEFFQLANLYNGYYQETERKLPFLKNKRKFNDFMLYLYGFFGEQCKFQNSTSTAAIMDNYCRNTYLFDVISKEFPDIDVEDIVLKEIGVTCKELSAALWCISAVALKDPFILNADKYYNRGIITKEKVRLVVEYFSSDISTIKDSKLERQQLYATPFIKLSANNYILNNVYLLLFLFENATYWVIRNHFQKANSKKFIITFGDYFEFYFKQVLERYLENDMFHKVPEGKEKRADWFLQIGGFTFLIEQKSALTGLNAKQQISDVEQTKTYIIRNWIKALKQLSNTEKIYNDKCEHIIKIVLVYEDYFKDEILDNAFLLEENQIEDDGYYWLASIDDIEMLLHTYKNHPEIFKQIIEDKIEAETSKSMGGRELGQIMQRHDIDTNEHIHSYPYISYKTNLMDSLKD